MVVGALHELQTFFAHHWRPGNKFARSPPAVELPLKLRFISNDETSGGNAPLAV
jgi:hypothetical protein